MPRATTSAALVTFVIGSVVTQVVCGWQAASAAPRQAQPSGRSSQSQRGRPSPAPSSREGSSLLINGRSQQAQWRWIGASGQPPLQLWLPLEVLQNQLGVSSRSLPDGSLDLEWFGQGLKVPPAGQQALSAQEALDPLSLVRTQGESVEA